MILPEYPALLAWTSSFRGNKKIEDTTLFVEKKKKKKKKEKKCLVNSPTSNVNGYLLSRTVACRALHRSFERGQKVFVHRL